jgi:hypothetical protein
MVNFPTAVNIPELPMLWSILKLSNAGKEFCRARPRFAAKYNMKARA